MIKTLSRISLGCGIALLISAAATLVFVSASHPVAIGQAAFGLSALGFYFFSNRDALGRTFAGRATMFYGVSAVTGLLLLGGLVAANYVAAKKKITWDLTKGAIHTLSADTVKTLSSLPGEVKISAFYGAGEGEAAVLKELLDRYQPFAGDKLVVEWVDPFNEPETVKSRGIKAGGPRVIISHGAAEARTKDLSEEAITNSIVKVLHTSTKQVYFLNGHGEPDPSNAALENGYEMVSTKMGNEGLVRAGLALASQPIPEDAAALILLGPTRPLFDAEVSALKSYLDKGGRLLVGLEPGFSDPGLEAMLREYGFELDDSMIVDPLSKVMGGGGAAVPVIKDYASHEITKGFDLATVFPTARPVTALGDRTPRPVILATTNPTAWGETHPEAGEVQFDEGEKRGALGVMAAVSRPAGTGETRIVVFGDSEFANNQFGKAGGNADLFLNTVAWLASQESRITIRPKTRESTRLLLTESDAEMINLFSMNALPMLVLALGLSVWLVRKAK